MAPLGSPVALRPTVWGGPTVSVVVTVMSVGDPASAEVDAGTPIEKSLGSALTTRVKLCVVGVPAPDALMVKAYEPLEPTAGVPASVAVPSPLSVKVTPPGRGELPIDSDGVGTPVVVTVKDPAVPSVKVVVVAEEMVAGVSTVRVKVVVCEAAVPVPVTVIGYVPAGVAEVVAMVIVDDPSEVIVAGANWAVAPLGSPLAVSPTDCGPPEMVAVVMLAVAGEPTTAVPDDGVVVIEKSPGGGGAAPALNRAMPAAQYMAVVKVPA